MDFRIPRSTVDGLDEAGYFWAVIEPLWPTAKVENELKHLALATPGQRALYVLTLFFREVNNGGLNQFFFNSSGVYAGEIRKALRLLGAEEQAASFEKALSIFPGKRVPSDQEERQAVLESIPKKRRQAFFEPLDKEFYGEHHIWPYFQKYIDMHPNEFFTDSPAGPSGAK